MQCLGVGVAQRKMGVGWPGASPRLQPLRDEDLRQKGEAPQHPRVPPLPGARPHPAPLPAPVQQQRRRAPRHAHAAQVHHGRQRVLPELPHRPHEGVRRPRAARPDEPDPDRPGPPRRLPVVGVGLRNPVRAAPAEEDGRAGDEEHPEEGEGCRCAFPQALRAGSGGTTHGAGAGLGETSARDTTPGAAWMRPPRKQAGAAGARDAPTAPPRRPPREAR